MNNPKLIVKPFAKNGQKNVIPENYETSMDSNQATWDQGFGQITMLPVAAGGLPPKGQDFNGILNQISENIVYQSQGGRFKFSPEYAESIGGYPKGAILQSDDEKKEYQSLIDNNKVNFNTESNISASWELVGVKYAIKTEVDLALMKKFDKENISSTLGNDNGKVPSLHLFTTEIGKLQPKGNYQEAGYSYSKEESNNNFQPKGDYATKEELNSGLDLKLSKDSIDQSPGVATNKVMSQAGVTNNFTSRENFSTGSSDAWMRTPNKSSVIQITDVGEFNFLHESNYAFSVSSNGEISNGSINASRVTGLFSKYTDVTSQRSSGINYTNPENKPMFVSISFGNTNGNLIVTVNGVVVYSTGNTSDGITRMSASFIVPPGGTYKVESPAGFNLWSECV